MTPFQPGSPMDQFFRQFFGENGPNQMMPHMPQRPEEALGSGFIINSNGTIVTNNHVVDARQFDQGDARQRPEVRRQADRP